MQKTLLIGNFGAHNLGDELILSAGLEAYPESIVMTNDAQYSQTFCETSFPTVPFFPTGFRSFWKFFTNPTYKTSLQNLRGKITQIVFPGGGLFAITLRAYFLWFLVFVWVKRYFPKAEIRFEHQGVDISHDFLSKFFAQYALRQAHYISVRDSNSKQAVLNLVEKEVENVGDRVCFQTWDKSSNPTRKKTVLINALTLFMTHAFEKAYSEVFPEKDFDPIFIAFQESDLKNVPNHFFAKAIFPKTKTELINAFLGASTVIGERFHCLVLGESLCGSENTFTLRKPYSEKVATFCDEKGIERF